MESCKLGPRSGKSGDYIIVINTMAKFEWGWTENCVTWRVGDEWRKFDDDFLVFGGRWWEESFCCWHWWWWW